MEFTVTMSISDCAIFLFVGIVCLFSSYVWKKSYDIRQNLWANTLENVGYGSVVIGVFFPIAHFLGF